MSKTRSERQRWVKVCQIPEPSASAADGYSKAKHNEARAVVDALHQLNRVVRVELSQFGNGLVLKARRA